tara:strand:- start:13418 stop:13864 length:447 start_codon:yes stop_codon:yes gene_type:complete
MARYLTTENLSSRLILSPLVGLSEAVFQGTADRPSSIITNDSVEVHVTEEGKEGETIISICPNPWISGTRAAAYFGPVAVEDHCPTVEGFEELYWSVCRELAGKAYLLEATHVVGTEFEASPFEVVDDKVVILLRAWGTMAKLEPLFG